MHGAATAASQLVHLLVPREWQEEAIRNANKWTGTTEQVRYLQEARRYALMADYLELMDKRISQAMDYVNETREFIDKLLGDKEDKEFQRCDTCPQACTTPEQCVAARRDGV